MPYRSLCLLRGGHVITDIFRWSAAVAVPFILALGCTSARADTLTLTFDVKVWDVFNYATMTSDFHGFSTAMKVTFDGAVTGVEQDPNDIGVFFGTPQITSPLTSTLPYHPFKGEPPPSRLVLLANRDYGPTQQWSEFTIVAAQDTESGPITWAYDFDLDSGSLYPLIPNLLQDPSTALRDQLTEYERNHSSLTFDEFAYEFDADTTLYLAGTAYDSTAYLVNVVDTPEPSTGVALGCVGLVLLTLGPLVQARAHTKKTVQ